MITYVALLRGINIGGNNKVEMIRLKASFISLGFSNVFTYLNSGNVIFSDAGKNTKKISSDIEKEILKEFKLNIKVMVRDIKNIQETLHSIPTSWMNDCRMLPHVAFLWAEIDSPDILNQIDATVKSAQVKYIPGAIVWNVELKNWSKDTIYKFTNGPISKQVTVRSVNTLRKLNELMKQFK
jgi:uncharacterized protein (DUF1697 family)